MYIYVDIFNILMSFRCSRMVGPGKDFCCDLDPCWFEQRVVTMMYIWSSHIARVRINRVRLPILPKRVDNFSP